MLIWNGGLAELADLLLPAEPDPLVEAIKSVCNLPLSEMPQVLADVVAAGASLPHGAAVRAEIALRFVRSAGEDDIVNVHTVDGIVLPEGRFSVMHVVPATAEGAPAVLIDDVAYDGATFVKGERGLPFYAAYASSSSGQRATMNVTAGFLWGLLEWVDDPMQVLRLQGSAFSVETDPLLPAVSIVTESYPGIQAPFKGTTTYWIDSAFQPPRVRRIEIHNDQGELSERRTYEGYREFGAGNWRPSLVTETRYSGGEQNPTLVRSLRIHSAQALTAEDVAGGLELPASAESWWFVWI